MDGFSGNTLELESATQSSQQRRGGSTRYRELAGFFRAKIHTGAWAVGDRLPSFNELRRDGFSVQTIEKAQQLLENEGLVERRPRSGVYVARTETQAIGSPLKGRKGIIGFCGADLGSHGGPYWSQLLSGVSEAVGQEMSNVILLDLKVNSSGWDKVDGVLVAGFAFEESYDLLSKLVPSHVPAVSLLSRGHDASSVLADDYEGCRRLTSELIRQGHRDIAYIAMVNFMTVHRVQGYQAAMRHAGLDPDGGILPLVQQRNDDCFVERGRRAVQFYLSQDWAKKMPSAVMMHNDQAAIGAIQAFEASGVRVPDDVSVAGYDDSESEGHFRPLLTTVRVPLRELGIAGVELLQRQIDDRDVMPRTVMLPTQTLIRGSTRARL